MQPLYSVDHETRQSSNRVEEPSPMPQEDTPLLHRFPPGDHMDKNLFMTLTVSLLLFILITGVIIGIYLLVLQNNAENILPPVETPLQLVSRKQWNGIYAHPLSISPGKVNQVIIVQTDTKQCLSNADCVDLLQTMQTDGSGNKPLSYNFLVSPIGQTYVSLGWFRTSPLFPQYPRSLVLAFIGNFTMIPPVNIQMQGAKNFFAESVSQGHLEPDYVVAGKSTAYKPISLFDSLKTLPQWKGELLD